MQISRSRWQDSCFVVWSSCNREASLATNCACLAARRSQYDDSAGNNSLGEFFFGQFFFPFLFLAQRERFRLVGIGRRPTCRSAEAGGKTCVLWYGTVETGMPVSQRTALVLLRVDRKRRIGQQQQSRGILFWSIIFSFSLSRTERTSFGWWGFVVDRHADQQKQVARLVPCGTVPLKLGCQSRNDLRLSCCASIADDSSASNNSLGEFFFSRNYFFLFSFLAQSERVSVDADCASNDMHICRSRWQDLCAVV